MPLIFSGIAILIYSHPSSLVTTQVGHAIARHSAEMITKNLWFAVLQLIILQFVFMPDIISTMSNLLLRLPFSRK